VRTHSSIILYRFCTIAALAALLSGCGDETIFAPTLSSQPEQPSAVSRPVLARTLPASWDENWFASPAVYDLDGDGAREIIAARNSVVYVWSSSGSLLWRAAVGEHASSSTTTGGSHRIYCSPVVGDIDNDGMGEIAIVYNNNLCVYDHQGRVAPGWPQSFPGSSDEIRSLCAADLDNDNRLELAVVKTGKGPVTMVWHSDGRPKSGWPQLSDTVGKYDFGGYNQNVGCVDLDGDGQRDLVATYDLCHIGIFTARGEAWRAHERFAAHYSCAVPLFHDTALALRGWGADGNDRDELTDSPPVFADMDHDGLPEIIVYSDHERAGEYVNRGNSLWVLNPDMSRVAGFERPHTSGTPLFIDYQDNIVQVAPAPCIAKLGGDGPSIIVPSYDGYLRCFGPGGAVQWQVLFGRGGADFIGASEAAAADLDNDGVSEIVFTTYALNKGRSHLFILDKSGALLHRISLPGRGAMSAPTIDDVDSDGVLEIIISLKDVVGQGAGGVQIYTLASARRSVVEWPTGRGTYLRSGSGQGP
jgi:hypothetical protein